MEVTFYTQSSRALGDIVKELAADSSSIRIAVAYLSADGLEEVRPYCQDIDVRIVCGVHGCISDLWALKDLVCRPDLQVQGHVFSGQNLFHPKLYIFNGVSEGMTALIGSPNFTFGGLKTNEEVYVGIRGQESAQPIRDAVNYFNNLWTQRSISVESYLLQHPEYKVKVPIHESLTPEQDKVLSSLKAVVQRETCFTFENEAIPTLFKEGRQTIPKKYNNSIASCNLMEPRQSTLFEIVLPDGSTVDGKIRYGNNNWGDYYEILVGDKDNRSKLNKLISENDMLEYYVDIVQRIVSIRRV
ncbi:restriction endonuclease PLD domain-containing protein [Allocoleopsis franciscana]|uniref:Putative HKD family nuclease n=1 Tax=Allocoleopsis franciscana PCC 7113 TaxID=1173027 RepID=K9W9Q2_9CYAN|nr:restriction endonuclease PLD domain-containing protein [Allocoleopsis franciscana]AFZ17080.1 putative HKD family nuclease [Allocoleopsis franciscana PCC 7113]